MCRTIGSCRHFAPNTGSNSSVFYYGNFKVRTVGFLCLVMDPYPFMDVMVVIRNNGANVRALRAIGLATFGTICRLLRFAFKDGRANGVRPFTCPSFHVQLRAPTCLFVVFGISPFGALSSKITGGLVSNCLMVTCTTVRQKIFGFNALVEMSFQDLTQRPLRLFRSETSLGRLLGNVQARGIVISVVRAIQIYAFIAFQPLLNVASYARAARISSQRRVHNVLLLGRMKRERIQYVNVIRVAPRRRQGDTCANQPWSM